MEERLPFPWFSALSWALIGVMVLVNIALHGDFVRSGEAVDPTSFGRAPAQDSDELTEADLAEIDDSDDLPGDFVPSQGRQHTGSYPLAVRIPFCDDGQAPVADECYASNPPSSGRHIGVQADVRLEDGSTVDLPPSPGVYQFVVPRESIPHIQEHAGVYLGYNCETRLCDDAVRDATGVVEQELEQGRRVVMSPDRDLDPDTIALASWTRVDVFAAASSSEERVRDFIRAHSCRFDPEGFCDQPQTN